MSTVKTRLLDRFKLGFSESLIEGEKVFLKQLSDAEVERYQFARIDRKTGEMDFSKVEGAQAELVALCLCEEDGKRPFKNGKEVADTFPSVFVKAAYKVCSEFNGMGAAEVEEAGKG